MEKSKVTLRQKELKNGRISLYLDFYPPILDTKKNKYTRRDFLKIYLFKKPKDQIQKISNIENRRTAELIQAKRQNEICKKNIYTKFEQEQLQIQAIGHESFLKFFKKLGHKKIGNNWKNRSN